MSVADEQLQARLAELRHESQLGEARLRELMQQESALRETLLRISGAVQVLQELLGSSADAAAAPPAGAPPAPPPSDNGAHPGPVLTVP